MSPWFREVFAFLGLGSNLGDRLGYLQTGIDALAADALTRVEAVSSVYETAPVLSSADGAVVYDGPEQDAYLNAAARVATRRSPGQLLALCHEVEQLAGRERDERWQARTLDVDILLYDDRTVSRKRLQIPHPRLGERPFALIPLIEVAPGARLPDGRSLPAVLARLAPVEGVSMIGNQLRVPVQGERS